MSNLNQLALCIVIGLIVNWKWVLCEEEQVQPEIARFQQYLRINTAHPNPDYTPAISFLIDYAHSIGLQSQIYEPMGKPILIITWLGVDPTLPSILFNSHLDSIPSGPISHWSHPPFSAFRSPSGHIFSRGSQDDKSISLQYLESIRSLNLSAFRPLRTVHLSYVPDEEIGGAHGWGAFVNSPEFRALNVGFALDEGQACVGDEFRVFYADKIPWNVVIRAVGPTGHGSTMFDGGALENLARSMEVVSRFRESQFDVVKAGLAAYSEIISVNPVYLKSGIPSSSTEFVKNVQPSEAVAGFDVRLPPMADAELLRKRISEEWAPTSRNMTYEITEKGPLNDNAGRPLMTPTDDSNPWWSVFQQAITEAGGKLGKPEILPSATDARYLRQIGIPVLGFSPMSNTPILLHDNDEFLKDSVYLRGIKIYESIIRCVSSYDGKI